MKLKDGFKMRNVCGECIIVAEGKGLVNFNKMISLNKSAAYLWENVFGKEFTTEDLAQLLVDQYGIDMELAMKDSANLVKSWSEAELFD